MKKPDKMSEEQHIVLCSLEDLLQKIGSANDAEDHGYSEDAARMRRDACQAIQELISQHVFLTELFPKINWELDTQHILGFGWAELCNRVDAYLEVSDSVHGKNIRSTFRPKNPIQHSGNNNRSCTPCRLCSGLSDQEYAFQKYGWEKGSTYLPVAAEQLTLVRDLKPHSSRKLQIKQCPECGTFYLYKTDYEYFVNGSEDEEFLTRLSEKEASEYLKTIYNKKHE